ncbi:FAD binding domain-containing protein [Desulfofalx alkaliphila]|uniref:FAD binding domain-containing protein n=1 Tax=Desulfofalx alkaliphila TaxID=105483 RepID=UPI0004E1FEE0|nr:FAD binding domain-containing protein [Desulfofalx alkaliphila]
MFTVDKLVQPDSIEEAYSLLINNKRATVLGGCAFLKLGSRKIDTAIDLSKLNLDYITEHHDNIEIGAMATFRDLETNDALNKYFNAVIPKSVSNIIGVQFRNVVTVGASVFSKYGFSDLITALLALDTDVELCKGGRMPLEQYLNRPAEKDILTRVFIHKDDRKASYHSLRNSISDFPILNAAVSKIGNDWRIVVGARPTKATLAHKAAAELAKGNLTPDMVKRAAKIAAEELSFGTNMLASAEYRTAMCEVLVTRAVTEVLACK